MGAASAVQHSTGAYGVEAFLTREQTNPLCTERGAQPFVDLKGE